MPFDHESGFHYGDEDAIEAVATAGDKARHRILRGLFPALADRSLAEIDALFEAVLHPPAYLIAPSDLPPVDELREAMRKEPHRPFVGPLPCTMEPVPGPAALLAAARRLDPDQRRQLAALLAVDILHEMVAARGRFRGMLDTLCQERDRRDDDAGD